MLALEQIKGWWLYLSYCFSSDYTSVVCKPYWTWVAYGTLAVAGYIFFLVGRSVLREHLEYRRNRLRLEARAVVAPAEVIAAAKWNGDALEGDPQDLESSDLAEKFRSALEKRKSELLNSESVLTAK